MKFSRTVKLLFFLLLGVSLTFGLLTRQDRAPVVPEPNHLLPVNASLSTADSTQAQRFAKISQYKQKAWMNRVNYRRNEPSTLRYVPNEIIVKYTNQAVRAITSEPGQGAGVRISKAPSSFDALNQKFNVQDIRPLISNFRQNQSKRIQESQLDENGRTEPANRQSSDFQVKTPSLNQIYKLTLEPQEGLSLADVVAAYNSSGLVEYAELNYIVSTDQTYPDDPLFSNQWSLNNTGQEYLPGFTGTPDSDIDAPDAWDISTGSSGVIVAVIDTGVDYTHRDIDDNMWTDPNGYFGYDFVNDDTDPNDDNGHGTHCAGTIGAEGGNGLDITGVCWDVKIMAVKFLDANGQGSTSDAIEAIYYAVANGADILSNSWGGEEYSLSLQEAINYAHNQGVIIVASAGNDGTDSQLYPAAYDHVISVAATDSDDKKAGFSTYGSWVDIAAPGVDILSLRAKGTFLEGTYDDYTTVLSGTSMACPHVAGACALLLATNPLLTSNEVRDILFDSVDLIEDGDSISASGGRLNLAQALYEATPSKGRVSLDKEVYTCSGKIGIRLSDADLAGFAQWDVAVITSAGDQETVTLDQTDGDPGVFAGMIQAASNGLVPEDGTLQIDHGDTITVIYLDADDGGGNAVEAIDRASADCMGPQVNNITIDGPGSIVTIRFQTDEMATAKVSGSFACQGDETVIVSSKQLTTYHSLTLTNVEPQTNYFFVIEVSDSVGNRTIDDNEGSCYEFTTTSILGDIYVPVDFPDIQSAVDRAWDEDTIWVADGIYTGDGNYNIDFRGKAVTLRSENGPDNCVIDCQMKGRAFFFHTDEDLDSVLDGFTVQYGYPPADVSPTINFDVWLGGGIYCKDSAPLIRNCIITDCFSPYWGGGMAINNNAATEWIHIENCTIIQNRAALWGGGISCSGKVMLTDMQCTNNAAGAGGGGIDAGGRLILEGSMIADNVVESPSAALGYGGGINASGKLEISNSVVRANRGRYGGGVFCFEDTAVFVNCIFDENSAPYGGGLSYYGGQVWLTNCTFTKNSADFYGGAVGYYQSVSQNQTIIQNSILWDNRAGIGANEIYFPARDSELTITNSNIKDGQSGIVIGDSTSLNFDQTNIQVDPGFALDGDYHLTEGSAAVNAGTNDPAGGLTETDIESNPRVSGSIVDMGAYEFNEAVPIIAFSPAVFRFKGFESETDPNNQTLSLRNSAGGFLSWQIEENCPWLQIDNSAGTSEGEVDSINLSVQTSGLSAGNYLCTLTVSDENAANSPRQIPVKLHISGMLNVPQKYPTIQAAINAAENEDTVLVADGLYTGNGNRDIHFFGKSITVKSQNGPEHCVMDCQGTVVSPHRGFTVSAGNKSFYAVVDGFSITGGLVTSDYYAIFPPSQGGGIYSGSGGITIQNCIITDNACFRGGLFPAWGGGVMLDNPSSDKVSIHKCTIQDNHVDTSGGGLFAIASFLMENSLLAQNDSTVSGGGLHTIPYDDSSEIINCTFAGNTSGLGGGVCVDGSSSGINDQVLLTMTNSILADNNASNGSQMAMAQIYSEFFAQAGISYCDIEAAQNAIYVEEGFVLNQGFGMIHDDPLFVDPGQGDYRLMSASPVIERGSNELIKHISQTDLDGNSRFLDADYDGLPRVDMGAYEFVPTPFQGPLIEISEWQFDFVAYQGENNPPQQVFSIRNSGTGLIQWQIPDSCTWLAVSPSQGTSSGELTEVTLQPDITGLARGLYTCQLAVEDPAAANHPRTFTVTLRVFERGKLYVPDEFDTIQAAVNAAVDNDRIIIAPGTYTEDIYIPGKNITLTSQDPNDPSTVAATIITGTGTNPVVTFAGTERSAKLLGLTVTGGLADSGGGIQGNGTGAGVKKCIIHSNTATDSGGGIHGVLGPVRSCRIEDNTASFGGALADCNDVINCIIASNTAEEGGGLYNTTGNIIHCTITDNTADIGGGLSRCTGLIQSNIIWSNAPDALYQSSLPSFSCVQGDPRGAGNIDVDPQFIDPDGGDWRLLPGSLCIDAADPNSVFTVNADIVDTPRPLDGDNDGSILPDIGAYEMPLSDQVVIGISGSGFVFTNLDSTPQTFRIWNAGLPAVHYAITASDCPWLTVSPTDGTVLGSADTITLTVDPSQVPAGSFTCELVISDPAAINSPRRVNVQLKVLQDQIHLTPDGPTIQYALSYVTDGGTLILTDGVYSGPGNRDIDFLGRPATIRSQNGPENCILDLQGDPNNPHRAFLFRNNEGSDSIIRGLTIVNGFTPQSGGAVFCDRSSPTLVDCVFENNSSEEDGGAVYAQFGSLSISRCAFQSNSADRGGAAACIQGSLDIDESSLTANSARVGGALFDRFGTITARECSFTQNTADDGGAVYHQQGQGRLTDCQFLENTATFADWYHGGGAVFVIDSSLTVTGCRFHANQSAWDGGAIENWRSDPHISQCEFTGNVASGNDGGAVFNISGSDPNIVRCTFTENHAKSWGGAMRNRQSSPRIDNCLFVANDAVDNGGAVFNFLQSDPSVINCTFVQNTANGNGGGAMYSLNNCTPAIVNSIFWDNEAPQVFDSEAATTITYSNIDWPGTGNADLNPQFMDADNGDFRLTRTSPCIDSGTDVPLAGDLAGDPRPWDCPWAADSSSGFDRGAYEFAAVPASLKITPQAINCKSRGKDPRGRLEFGSDINADNIDKTAPVLIMSEQFVFEAADVGFSGKKKRSSLDVSIDRDRLCGFSVDSGHIRLSITGLLTDGRTFYAADTVRLKAD